MGCLKEIFNYLILVAYLLFVAIICLFAFDSAWKDWQVFVLMILLTSPIILLRFKRMRGGSSDGGGSCGGGCGGCGGGD
jgi:hypothetical protein|tara:strand:+ start:288 stop:524 length:237 start_codon:yes stop_codon:yes gene_type:complete